MVERWGLGMAEGFLHDLQGWVMFMLSTGCAVFRRAAHRGAAARSLSAARLRPQRPCRARAGRAAHASAHASLAASAALSVALCAVGLFAPRARRCRAGARAPERMADADGRVAAGAGTRSIASTSTRSSSTTIYSRISPPARAGP